MITITQDDIDKKLSEVCTYCSGTGYVRDPVLFRWVECRCKNKVAMKIIEHGGDYE